jgi:hypothetical protein
MLAVAACVDGGWIGWLGGWEREVGRMREVSLCLATIIFILKPYPILTSFLWHQCSDASAAQPLHFGVIRKSVHDKRVMWRLRCGTAMVPLFRSWCSQENSHLRLPPPVRLCVCQQCGHGDRARLSPGAETSTTVWWT